MIILENPKLFGITLKCWQSYLSPHFCVFNQYMINDTMKWSVCNIGYNYLEADKIEGYKKTTWSQSNDTILIT